MSSSSLSNISSHAKSCTSDSKFTKSYPVTWKHVTLFAISVDTTRIKKKGEKRLFVKIKIRKFQTPNSSTLHGSFFFLLVLNFLHNIWWFQLTRLAIVQKVSSKWSLVTEKNPLWYSYWRSEWKIVLNLAYLSIYCYVLFFQHVVISIFVNNYLFFSNQSGPGLVVTACALDLLEKAVFRQSLLHIIRLIDCQNFAITKIEHHITIYN